MKYSIKHDALTCMVEADGKKLIHLTDDRPPAINDSTDWVWHSLPQTVQDAAARQYKAIFSRPVSERTTDFLNSVQPVHVNVLE